MEANYLYAETFKEGRSDGRPPTLAWIAFGGIYIKEQEKFADERTVEISRESVEHLYASENLSLNALVEGRPANIRQTYRF